jgi:hypothetical protein
VNDFVRCASWNLASSSRTLVAAATIFLCLRDRLRDRDDVRQVEQVDDPGDALLDGSTHDVVRPSHRRHGVHQQVVRETAERLRYRAVAVRVHIELHRQMDVPVI